MKKPNLMDNTTTNVQGREIKFRCWDGEEMLFVHQLDIYPDSKNCRVNCSVQSHYDKWPIMQFTGLRDKSGKEIYEFDRWGDVMGLSTKATVIMHEGCWSLKWDTGAIGNLDAHVKTKAGNVVGNIFESEGIVVSEGLIDNGV